MTSLLPASMLVTICFVAASAAPLAQTSTAQGAARGAKPAPPKPATPRSPAQRPAAPRPTQAAPPLANAPEQVQAGQALFVAQCGFCHGREATGGQSGPDLTESPLVASDVNGDKIGVVVRNGRPEKGMPPFSLSDSDLAAVVAFVHTQKSRMDAQPGRRRRVAVSDLQTGNADAGKQYFNGPGGCAACHSPTGDLAGIGTRLTGLGLLQRMLYPSGASPSPAAAATVAKEGPVTVTVTLPSGSTVSGTLAYRDEFTIALTDASGWYRAWPASQVKYTVRDRLDAHVQHLGKYTDKDMHDVFAYLETLR